MTTQAIINGGTKASGNAPKTNAVITVVRVNGWRVCDDLLFPVRAYVDDFINTTAMKRLEACAAINTNGSFWGAMDVSNENLTRNSSTSEITP
ncbi:hypothetical protein SDC9_212857 [bioreactor metagenome]|uniref:Uncharacterized protein n=1 Tax=bioreactor metagenome TaxID=1076179 RepID=A0A645JN44_9ZZZZ